MSERLRRWWLPLLVLWSILMGSLAWVVVYGDGTFIRGYAAFWFVFAAVRFTTHFVRAVEL